MKFKLDRDLVFFDVESTGLNVIRDRIIQLAMIKYFKDGRDPEELSMLINPGVPIPAESTAVHGITAADVANAPTFFQMADKIHRFIGDADLAGYNSNRFDIPILMEEFARAAITFDIDKRRTIDVQRIFYKMEPRTLKAAYKFYCDEDLVDAHDALVDVRATAEVLKGQLERYSGVEVVTDDGEVLQDPVKNDMQVLHDFTNDFNTIDATQRLKKNSDGVIVFNFGKYINQPAAKVLYDDKQYYHWMLDKDFSSQVKQIIKRLRDDYEQKMRST
jgi:DNA polymerase III subunit epsilon